MCNPRRVEVSATRQLEEAWSREARRVVSLTGVATGEARVVQALDSSVSRPVLRLLARLLAEEGVAGWSRDEDGAWRSEVEGGFVRYHPERAELELVARATSELRVEGEAQQTLTGQVTAEIQATAQGRYYDDNWQGHTRERAIEQATAAAQRALDDASRAQVEAAAAQAEQEIAAALEASAQEAARRNLASRGAEEQDRLAAEAARHLATVGVRGRRAFHELLAQAYARALRAYAISRGVAAGDIRQREDAGVIDIEFLLPD